MLRDIIILHMCTKNSDQMMYSSWDMVSDRCNCYFSFWAIFCHFTPLTAKKIKILKKWKKGPRDIIILHMCTKNYDRMMYGSWDMVHDRCNCYILFWAIFCPFAHLTAQKIKILKKWIRSMEILSFYICVPKIMIRLCMVPEIWCMTDRWTDGWMDGQTNRRIGGRRVGHIDGWADGWTDREGGRMEKVTCRGGCPT